MARTYNLENPEDMERWTSNTLNDQRQERREFEAKIEQHDKLLLKYRKELYNEKPDAPRLFQLQRIITQFIDLLTRDKYKAGSYNTYVEGHSMPLANFLEWKQRLSDRVINEYTSLLNSVSVRAMQRAQDSSLTVKKDELTKEERIATLGLMGEDARVRALVRILQNGSPMTRERDGNHCYHHYGKLVRKNDRTAFASEGKRCKNELLKVYESALKYLQPQQRELAETEMFIIRGEIRPKNGKGL